MKFKVAYLLNNIKSYRKNKKTIKDMNKDYLKVELKDLLEFYLVRYIFWGKR